MASFYPLRREGPLNLQSVAASLRSGHSRQEAAQRRLNTPLTASQKLHKELVSKDKKSTDVLEIVVAVGDDLDANNVATAVHKAAQLSKREGREAVAAVLGDPRLDSLLDRASHHVAEWTSRQLCHVAWSVAAITMKADPLLVAVSLQFSSLQLNEGVPQDISTFAWALAVVSLGQRELFENISDRAKVKIAEFCPQDLSITAWAFAKVLAENRRPLLCLIASESIKKIDEFSGRNLANLSWAFATAQYRDLHLCERLVHHCSTRITELGAQELPIALWSFAAIGYPSDAVFQVAADQALGSLGGMDSSHLCNVIWSFARAGRRNEVLFTKMADYLVGRVGRMEPLHLSNLAWSFATVTRADEFDLRRDGIRHEPLFVEIAASTSRHARDLAPQHAASMLWAFASCTVSDAGRRLADVVYQSVRGGSQKYDPRHAAGMLWALATQLIRHEPLCDKILDGITSGGVDELAREGPAHLASITWAAATLGRGEHRGLRISLRSNVDGLLGALAGNLAELSDGRRQNIASVLQSLYVMGLAETAQALLIRFQDFGIQPGPEAWAAWLCGAMCNDDWFTEARSWRGLCAAFGDGFAYDHPRQTFITNALALRATAMNQRDDALRTITSLGPRANAVTALVCDRLGACQKLGQQNCVSPRGDSCAGLRAAQNLIRGMPAGDVDAFLARAEECFRNEPALAELLGFGVGPRGAVLDSALLHMPQGRPPVFLQIGCGIGCAVIRAARSLQRIGGRVVAYEADAVQAAIALNLVHWVGLEEIIDIRVGRSELLLPWLRRAHGPHCLAALLLCAQGSEYLEELSWAERVEVLNTNAVVIADRVLQPMAPELMWRFFKSGAYNGGAVVVEDDWIAVARVESAQLQNCCLLPPASIQQLRHSADEARRRGVPWSQRDRLECGKRRLRPEEAEAAVTNYAASGIQPRLAWPDDHGGSWHVNWLL